MKYALVLSACLLYPLAHAEVAVIVHPSNAAAMDADFVNKLYLGREKSFPGGATAIPLALADSNAAAGEFNDKVLKKSASQLKAYWSKLLFTGKGTPPKEIGSDAEMVSLVASNPNMIGFVDAAAVNDSVKVVTRF